jgi:predicted dehydrogenase
VGIVGLGVGEQHIAGYRTHPGCEVVALCDFDADRLEEVGTRNPGLRRVADSNEVLDDPEIDVVSIASYDNFHFEQVRRAVQNGKHVFVEKPLCQRPEEAEELHALLGSRPELRMSCNLPLRMSPRFRLVKEMVEGGDFGSLYYLEGDYDYGRLHKITEGWRGRLPYYSVILGGAVHMVDLLLWLSGGRVAEVSAYGNRIASAGTQFGFDDMVASIFTFESGAIGKVAANFGSVHPHFHDVKLFGTEATFVNGLQDGVVYRRHEGDIRPSEVTAPYPGMLKGDLIHGFVESVRSGTEPPVTARDVFETMTVCFAIEKAARGSGPVEVRHFD